MNQKMWWKWAAALSLAFLLAACGSKKEVKTIQGDPEVLYKQGLVLFNKRLYPDALKKFEEVRSNFPDSPPYTVWAELKIADSHFHKEEYAEAIAGYEEFKKIHPTNEEIVYVQYQLGNSYYNQMLSADRDQTSTKKALSNFDYLIASYPTSFFTEKAKEKMEVCRKRLADQEFYIGDFYYKQKNYPAAAVRFKESLEKFPKVPGEDKTLFFLGKSYLEIEQEEKAKEALARIVNSYPKSSYYKEAKAILDRGATVRKRSAHKPKARKGGEAIATDSDAIALAKFEEERRKPVSLAEETGSETRQRETKASLLPVASPPEPLPTMEESEKKTAPVAGSPIQEERAQAAAPPSSQVQPKPEEEVKTEPEEEKREAFPPPVIVGSDKPLPLGEEHAQAIPPSQGQAKIEIKSEATPEEAKRVAALPRIPLTSGEVNKPKKEFLQEPGQPKLVDTGEPIDITSDKVESYSKDNLILFKGNVMARQKDIVIYADSVEALITDEGKGIDRVVADGNVKVQQGLRVASCNRAVFYNLDQRVVLTGDPKVWDGDNMVSGDEIIFDIEQNRVEVKGGQSGRGKLRIQPGSELEKPK